MQNTERYSTFECVKPHFNSLAKVGYYEYVLKKNITPMKLMMHYVYRMVMSTLVLCYNLQHVIKVVQVRHSTELMVNTLFILLTTLSALGKKVTFNARNGRINNIISIINGPLFATTNQYHVELLKRETKTMFQLLKLYHCMVFLCGSLWSAFPIVNRLLGEPDQFTGYIPFDTSSIIAFILAHVYMSIVITLQAYGNATMDCTIVAFFSQAKIQIQMLRNNLEEFVESTKINVKLIERHKHNVTDVIDNEDEIMLLQKRFVRCVEHYKLIVRFAKEVETIFGEATVAQFIVTTWVLCMTVYKIVGLSILSAEFVSMAVYLGCMMAQLFIYCYFGTQLKVESEFVNQSVYNSDWLSLPAGFRRQLLVMMQYCSRPIAPKIAYVVPMSLETYITVLKHSYTLFTFLDRK